MTIREKWKILQSLGWDYEFIHGNGVDDWVWVDPQRGQSYNENSPYLDCIANSHIEIKRKIIETAQNNGFYPNHNNPGSIDDEGNVTGSWLNNDMTGGGFIFCFRDLIDYYNDLTLH